MALVVQKFGGTSVADVKKIQSAAQKVIARHRAGDEGDARAPGRGGRVRVPRRNS